MNRAWLFGGGDQGLDLVDVILERAVENEANKLCRDVIYWTRSLSGLAVLEQNSRDRIK
jgi:hypothetical protein